MRLLLIGTALVIAAACGKPAATPQEPAENPSAVSEQPDETADDAESKTREASAMHERFLAVNAIREAVIAGDLPGARERARALAKDDKLLSVFADWGTYTESMRVEIQQASESADLRAVAVHTAAAAHACGRCHKSLGIATLDEDAGQLPKEPHNIGGIMRQHHWAINNMWDGLIAPSDKTWDIGSKTLADIATNAQSAPEVKADEQLSVLLRDVERYALEATRAVTGPERTEALGQLLTTCSTCHQKMRPPAGGTAATDSP